MIEKGLVAASTEPLILSLLAKGESYGYELIQEVKQRVLRDFGLSPETTRKEIMREVDRNRSDT